MAVEPRLKLRRPLVEEIDAFERNRRALAALPVKGISARAQPREEIPAKKEPEVPFGPPTHMPLGGSPREELYYLRRAVEEKKRREGKN